MRSSRPTSRTARALAAAVAFAMACVGLCAQAQTAATPKSIRLVVPFPAGGTADILPRVVAEKMRAQFPGGVIVDNRSGAGGNIGGDSVFRAEADGSVLLASPPGPVAINHHLYKKMPFDPTRWVPVTVLATADGFSSMTLT